MKKIALTLLFFAAFFAAFPQTVTLIFTGEDAHGDYVQLDSVVVTNMTRGWTETLYWPDTVLEMQVQVGIDDATVETMCTSSLQLEQNNPNPFNGVTDVTLHVVDAGAVTLEMTDMNGRTIAVVEPHGRAALQQSGTHNFRITVANAGTYVLTAHQNGKTSSIKMVNNGRGNGNRIEYIGTAVEPHGRAAQNDRLDTQSHVSQQNKNAKGSCINPCYFGDQMNFILYATMNDTLVTSELMKQLVDGTYEVISNITLNGQPCHDTPTVKDIEDNIYNTVQIGNQCWMRENLKTTKYANGTDILEGSDTSSTIGYWYYPDNNSSNKKTYGLLYNWPAVMNGKSSSSANPSGVQGICPTGWHVPSDMEWIQLELYVESQSQYTCGDFSYHYIAKALACTSGWRSTTYECSIGNNENVNNSTGFSALPAGYFWCNVYGFKEQSLFYSSTKNSIAVPTDNTEYNIYCCVLNYEFPSVLRYGHFHNSSAVSVRCLKD